MLDLPDGLHPSSSRTSLNSAEVYGDFERAEPVDLDFSTPSPGGSMERDTTSYSRHLTDTPPVSISDVLTKDMQNALLGTHRAVSSLVVKSCFMYVLGVLMAAFYRIPGPAAYNLYSSGAKIRIGSAHAATQY